MAPNRRDVLGFVGTTTAAVAISGRIPITVRAENEDDVPAYSQWLVLDEDDSLAFTFVDWERLGAEIEAEFEDFDPNEDTDVPPEFEVDPMIALPTAGMLSMYFSVALLLAPYRLGTLLQADEFESTVETLLQTGDALIVTGEMVPQEFDDRLTADPEAGFIRQFELTDEIGEYDVYTSIEADDETVIAVGEAALGIVVEDEAEPNVETADPLSTLESIVTAAEEADGRATDESESVEWLLENAGHGDVVVGRFGDPAVDDGPGLEPGGDVSDQEPEGLVDPKYEGLVDAEGLVSSLTVEDETTSTGEFAAIVPDPDEATLEETIGASADERSLEVDDDRVIATAEWRDAD